jgi:ERCC4-type nuclease
MLLLVDYREKWLLHKLQEFNFAIESETIQSMPFGQIQIQYKITNLEVGDFVIEFDSGMPLLIIERKTVRDLCASITDGRFRQQKERLSESVDSTEKIMYMIEGGMKKCHASSLSQTIIDGSILNLMFKHHFKVLFTENENDSFNNILLLYKKFHQGDFENQP